MRIVRMTLQLQASHERDRLKSNEAITLLKTSSALYLSWLSHRYTEYSFCRLL